MTVVSETWMDRRTWRAGPWDSEPDRVDWTDEASGYPCLMLRNAFGVWCGYVAVPPGHPFHGRDHDAVDVRVHGRLTFAEPCMDGELPVAPRDRICHAPTSGEFHTVWWFGFDCGHVVDLMPMAFDLPISPLGERVYRDLDYVRAEITGLAAQLAALDARNEIR